MQNTDNRIYPFLRPLIIGKTSFDTKYVIITKNVNTAKTINIPIATKTCFSSILIEQKKKESFIEPLYLLVAVWTGLEPATPCVTGMYSNQLNYHTILRSLNCECKCSAFFCFCKLFLDFLTKKNCSNYSYELLRNCLNLNQVISLRIVLDSCLIDIGHFSPLQ